MTKKELLASIHQGVRSANKLYMDWSGGAFLSEAGIEGFMVSHIAAAIMKSKNHPAFLELEVPIETLVERGGRKPRGPRPEKVGDKGRADIALFNARNMLSQVIEVKRLWSEQCEKDLDRIVYLQRHLGKQRQECSLKFGLLVLFAHASSPSGADLESAINGNTSAICSKARAYLEKKHVECGLSVPEKEPLKFKWQDENGKFRIDQATSVCIVVKCKDAI